MLVVADAGPLIALADLAQLDLLRGLFSEVLLPPAVDREAFVTRRRTRPAWLRISPPAGPPPASIVAERLDEGEREAPTLALSERRISSSWMTAAPESPENAPG